MAISIEKREKDNMSTTVQSIDRAFEILEALGNRPEGMLVKDLSATLGLNKSTVSRILATLAEHGYVAKNKNNYYRLGMRMVDLCSLYLNSLQLKTEALPFLEELRNQTCLLYTSKLKKFSKMGFVNRKEETASVLKLKQELHLACSSIENPAGSLSGGNQQKVVLAKFMDMPVEVYIFDEPTRGIDVGAKSEIYSLIEKISETGASVIVISSEIPEIQSICDRVAVMKEGEVVKILNPEEFRDAEIILKYSIGG